MGPASFGHVAITRCRSGSNCGVLAESAPDSASGDLFEFCKPLYSLLVTEFGSIPLGGSDATKRSPVQPPVQGCTCVSPHLILAKGQTATKRRSMPWQQPIPPDHDDEDRPGNGRVGIAASAESVEDHQKPATAKRNPHLPVRDRTQIGDSGGVFGVRSMTWVSQRCQVCFVSPVASFCLR